MTQILKKYWWVIVIVLVIGGAFYWFQLRPSQIRKECFWKVENPTASTDSGFVPGSIAKKYIGENYFDEKAYTRCLLEHGLEK